MNLHFSCGPSGQMFSVSAFRRRRDLEGWFLSLVSAHRARCPYCKFEKDANTGREIGQ